VAVAIVNGLIAAFLAWGWLRRSPTGQYDETAAHDASVRG